MATMPPYCYRCPGPIRMHKGIARANLHWTTGCRDFDEDPADTPGITVSQDMTRATTVAVWKCPGCGHSFLPRRPFVRDTEVTAEITRRQGVRAALRLTGEPGVQDDID